MMHAVPSTWTAVERERQRARRAVAEAYVAVHQHQRDDLQPKLRAVWDAYLARWGNPQHYRTVYTRACALKARLLH